jgi:hypothetical protein
MPCSKAIGNWRDNKYLKEGFTRGKIACSVLYDSGELLRPLGTASISMCRE